MQNLAENARIKGLDLLGTGDITHPRWFAEVSEHLEDDHGYFTLRATNKNHRNSSLHRK